MTPANLAKKLDRLIAADAVVADSYLRHVANKGVIGLLGALLAAMGLSLLGLSLFWVLERTLGTVSAGALVGMSFCALGASLLLSAARLRPPRELDLAVDIRRTVLQAIEEELSRDAPEELSREAPNGLNFKMHGLSSGTEALLSYALPQLIALFIGALRSRASGEHPPPAVGVSGPDQDGKSKPALGGA